MFVDVVWFKRDLRVTDHQALTEAAGSPYVLPVYVAEPEVLGHPTCSPRHIDFIRESLLDLSGQLLALGSDLVILQGGAVEVFEKLRADLAEGGVVFARLLAHQETGNWVTYQRDQAVGEWAKQNRIEFLEFAQSGVQRPIKSRDGWSARRKRWLLKEPLGVPKVLAGMPPVLALGGVPAGVGGVGMAGLGMAGVGGVGMAGLGAAGVEACELLNPTPEPEMAERQTGGRTAALARLSEFLEDSAERPADIRGYEKRLSSPITGVTGCSRMSVYLTYGCLTAREIRSFIDPVRDELPKRSVAAFEQRMAWRDHFTQKLEDEPELEWRAYHPALDEFRGDGTVLNDDQQILLDAWVNARTGFSMVDAVVNQLRQTGWTSFRMRAMLVSFASYDLWLPWQVTGVALARWFSDYEAGIHWPQMQMQSGVTGTNTMRIYDPVKQGRDHDPTGEFVGRYAAAGAGALTPGPPIVDHKERTAAARAALSEVRRRLRGEGVLDQILAKHGSRRPAPSRRPASSRRPAASRSGAASRRGSG